MPLRQGFVVYVAAYLGILLTSVQMLCHWALEYTRIFALSAHNESCADRPMQSSSKVLRRAVHTSSNSANISRMMQPRLLHRCAIYTLFWFYENLR